MAGPRTLLLTRPERQSAAFATALAQALPGRFRPLIAPVIRIAPVHGPVELEGVAALAFTSANGVEAFAAQHAGRELPAYCVGDITTEAARRAGFDARSAGGDVAALAALIAGQPPPGGAVLHVRGRHAAGDLTGRLASAGIPTRAAEIYEQIPCPITATARDLLVFGDVHVVTLFSPRSAALFASQAGAEGWALRGTTAVSLSAAADTALGDMAFGRRVVAETPSRDGMIAALASV